MCQVVLGGVARAAPIQYQETLYGGGVSGRLGGVTFTGAIVTFTTDADTSALIPYTLGDVIGAELLQGVTTVTIYPSAGPTLTATFLPSAGIFISLDRKNHGLGFGSFGVAPTDPAFPSQVTYPAALYVTGGDLTTYDLSTQRSFVGIVFSCVGFPSPCAAPLPLPTTAGDFSIDGVGPFGSFFSNLPSIVAFSRFNARGISSGRPTSSVALQGSFTLGGASNGFQPGLEWVSLGLGPYLFRIPYGSFQSTTGGGWTYSGTHDLVDLTVQLTPVSSTAWTFSVNAVGSPIQGMTGSVPVQLTLGDDRGSGSVRFGSTRHGHDDRDDD
jgi:hypothetical protein